MICGTQMQNGQLGAPCSEMIKDFTMVKAEHQTNFGVGDWGL